MVDAMEPSKYRLSLNFLVGLILVGCSVYNLSLLEETDAPSNGQDSGGKAGGGGQEPQDSGQHPTDAASDANAGSRDGGNARNDSSDSLCGDGKLTGLENCDIAIASGETGSCPEQCESSDPCLKTTLVGTDCRRQCVETPIVDMVDDDGCCLEGANSTTDSDCPEVCGNAIIEGSETCDGECITASECTSDNYCIPAIFSGSANECNSTCTLTPIEDCSDDDACCPAGCTSDSDDDCSPYCGDGILQPDEACDDTSDEPCPTDCDDNDVCTADVLTGEASNCSATCTNIGITSPENNDGCCPPGATEVNDNDCEAVCGNNIREPSEECDDGNTTKFDGCDDQCRVESAEDRCRHYLNKDPSDVCYSCLCQQCGSDYLQCYANTDSRYDEVLQDHISTWCPRVRECASGETGMPGTPCTDIYCYCGTSLGCLLPNGPCVDVIRDSVPFGYTALNNPVTAVTDILAACARSSCLQQCPWAL